MNSPVFVRRKNVLGFGANVSTFSQQDADGGRNKRAVATLLPLNDTWGIRNKEGMWGRNMSIHLI